MSVSWSCHPLISGNALPVSWDTNPDVDEISEMCTHTVLLITAVVQGSHIIS